jgi:hypothetical protein
LVSGNNTEIVRVNAGQGDSYTLVTLDLVGLTGMDFDTSGTLYACQQDGDIFSIDITNGNYTLVTTATHGLNAITFNPTTNELWGALRKTFGNYKDSVYTIDLTTGEATPVGRTGLTVPTTDMAFDGQGNLYGVSGTSNQEGQFFQIDQTTGAGTLVGTGVGYNHTTGLAYSINGPVLSVDGGNSTLPQNYSLKQNFPNPFNPSTKIKYSIPEMSIVTLTLFNLLGEEVTTLVNEEKTAGNYTVEFNAANLPSGIYFYRIQAGSFVETKKMVLMK